MKVTHIHTSVVDWLAAGADCQVGIRLFKEYNPTSPLIPLISRQHVKFQKLVKDSLCHLAGIYKSHMSPSAKESTVEKVVPSKTSVRQDWPFLQDIDCPNELKILIGDKITAYYNYADAYSKIADALTPTDQSNLACYIVANYLEKQAITAELQHYKEKRIVLGKHPLFKEVVKYKDWRSLPPIEQSKMLSQIQYNIRRLERQLLTNDRPDLKINREKKLYSYQKDLIELKRIMS